MLFAIVMSEVNTREQQRVEFFFLFLCHSNYVMMKPFVKACSYLRYLTFYSKVNNMPLTKLSSLILNVPTVFFLSCYCNHADFTHLFCPYLFELRLKTEGSATSGYSGKNLATAHSSVLTDVPSVQSIDAEKLITLHAC